MGRIKNIEEYGITPIPIGTDYLIGTKSDNNGKTVNFKLSDIVALAAGGGTDTFSTLNGNILTLADGQTYDLTKTVDTDTNTFSTLSGTVITFEDGQTVDITTGNATLSGNTLTLGDGQTVDLTPVVDTDTNTFATLSGGTITFPDGQTLTIPAGSTDDQVASEVPISPITGLLATETQQALVEILSKIPLNTSNLVNDGEDGVNPFITSAGSGGGTDDQVASEVPITSITGLVAINTQQALAEILSKIPSDTSDLNNNGEDGTAPFTTITPAFLEVTTGASVGIRSVRANSMDNSANDYPIGSGAIELIFDIPSASVTGEYGALGIGSVCVGGLLSAGRSSVSLGAFARSSEDYGIAIGDNADSMGQGAIAAGRASEAGFESVAIGRGTKASGNRSVVIGSAPVTTGDDCIAIGTAASSTDDTGDRAVRIGHSIQTTGQDAVAIGSSAIAFENAVAIGKNSTTTQNGAVAIGGSIDGGIGAQARGIGSVAIGIEGRAESFYETSLGAFPTSHPTVLGNPNVGVWVATDRLFNLGNGLDDTNRSDALTILKNGTILAPSLTEALIDSADDKALITKEWFTSKVSVSTETITNIAATAFSGTLALEGLNVVHMYVANGVVTFRIRYNNVSQNGGAAIDINRLEIDLSSTGLTFPSVINLRGVMSRVDGVAGTTIDDFYLEYIDQQLIVARKDGNVISIPNPSGVDFEGNITLPIV